MINDHLMKIRKIFVGYFGLMLIGKSLMSSLIKIKGKETIKIDFARNMQRDDWC